VKKFFNMVKLKAKKWFFHIQRIRKGPVKLSNGTEVLPYQGDNKHPDNCPDICLIQRLNVFVTADNRLVIGLELYASNRSTWIFRGRVQGLLDHADAPEIKRLIVKARNAVGAFNSHVRCLKLFTKEEMADWAMSIDRYLDKVCDSTEPDNKLALKDVLEELGTWLVNDFNRRQNVYIRSKGKRWDKHYLKKNFVVRNEEVDTYTLTYVPPANNTLTMPDQGIREPQWFDTIVNQAVKEFKDYNKTYPIIVRAGVAYSRIGKHWIMNVGEKGILIKPDNRKEVLLTNKLLAASGANADNIHMFWVSYIHDGYDAKLAGIFHDWRINGVNSQSNT